MGTIAARKTAKGNALRYTAQIRIKRGGAIVHTEAKTFERKQAAEAWIRRRETELSEPGAIGRATTTDVTLSQAIDRYVAESRKKIGRTKAQVLKAINQYDIAAMPCAAIKSGDIVAWAKELSADRKPQTVGNYVSHLAAIFKIARPAWRYGLDEKAMDDAQTVLRSLGLVAKSDQRDRRPTVEELDRLMRHFADRQIRAPKSAPMHVIIAFAIFSTRRMDEITRITWREFDAKHRRVLVRDMKHPGQKKGNDVLVEMPDEALRIVAIMPRSAEQIFPYKPSTITKAFTDACKLLGIIDLHFHDLRHEGISRLFEMGRTIPQAASVSGHRSWHSLQRYTHLREAGDKYAGWQWLSEIAPQGIGDGALP